MYVASWKEPKPQCPSRKSSSMHITPEGKFHGANMGAHLGPTGPSWTPCWPHELCYLWQYLHFLAQHNKSYHVDIILSEAYILFFQNYRTLFAMKICLRMSYYLVQKGISMSYTPIGDGCNHKPPSALLHQRLPIPSTATTPWCSYFLSAKDKPGVS